MPGHVHAANICTGVVIVYILPVNHPALPNGTERATLSIRDRIVLHIYSCLVRSGGRSDVPVLTQTGIADALNITRAHAAIELERGSDKDIFYSEMARTGNGRRELKIYLLTPGGFAYANGLVADLESARIVAESIEEPSSHSPEKVFRELEDTDLALLGALRLKGDLDIRFTGLNKRVPFVIRNGSLLQLSSLASGAVDKMLEDGEKRRLSMSLLSDYCLRAGDHASRLKYLIGCGRIFEASRLVEFHSDELQNTEPKEIIDILIELESQLNRPKDSLLLLIARALLQLNRPAEAHKRLSSMSGRSAELRLTRYLTELEMKGKNSRNNAFADISDLPSNDREKSLYSRLVALSLYLSGDLDHAEAEVVRASRSAGRAGDVSELRMNYTLLSRIERAKGDFSEAARIESKLKGVDRMHARKSD